MKQFDSEHLEHIINSSIVSELFPGLPILWVLTDKLPKEIRITFFFFKQQDINDRVILYQREYSWGKTKSLPTSYSAATRDLIIQFLHEVSTKMEQLLLEQRTEPEAVSLT